MDDWVLDSLVGFLKSPTWSLAVGGFTDKNCVGEYSSAKTLRELVVCINSNCSCMPQQRALRAHGANQDVVLSRPVFDPGEENKFSYTDIHREYQKLVGLLAYLPLLFTPPAPWLACVCTRGLYSDSLHVFQVEGLLEKFTAELGISGDQFTHACSLLQTSKAGQENEVQ